MKDKDARKRLDVIEAENREYKLKGIKVVDCPKCKRPTLAKAEYAEGGYACYGGTMPSDIFQCLTCGCKFHTVEHNEVVK